jgi:hypothetical protein
MTEYQIYKSLLHNLNICEAFMGTNPCPFFGDPGGEILKKKRIFAPALDIRQMAEQQPEL